MIFLRQVTRRLRLAGLIMFSGCFLSENSVFAQIPTGYVQVGTCSTSPNYLIEVSISTSTLIYYQAVPIGSCVTVPLPVNTPFNVSAQAWDPASGSHVTNTLSVSSGYPVNSGDWLACVAEVNGSPPTWTVTIHQGGLNSGVVTFQETTQQQVTEMWGWLLSTLSPVGFAWGVGSGIVFGGSMLVFYALKKVFRDTDD